MKDNPKESLSNVARIFRDRLNKNINKMHVSRIKKEKEDVERCGKFALKRKEEKTKDDKNSKRCSTSN